MSILCQRPKRALFISTADLSKVKKDLESCQRPKRALFISTRKIWFVVDWELRCQRPKRALFISTDNRVVSKDSRDVSTP